MAGTTTIGLGIRINGTQDAIRDLSSIDTASQRLSGGLARGAYAAKRQWDAYRTTQKIIQEENQRTAQTGSAMSSGLGNAANTAKSRWDAYRNSQRQIQEESRRTGKSLDDVSQSLSRVQAAAQKSNLKAHAADIDRVAKACGLSTRTIESMVRSMQQAERVRAFRDLQQSANLSSVQLARLRMQMGDTTGALSALASGANNAKLALVGLTATLGFMAKSFLDAALQADRLDKAYTTITGSAAGAQAQLSYLYDISTTLGLQFQTTAKAAKGFFAAGMGSNLEGELKTIFEAVSMAGTALAMTTDEVSGAFLALGQMISKGKVQAEELRGQLGERLPGAFQLAAKAMNMSTAELDKFMAMGKLTAEELLPKLAKVLKEQYGDAALQAAQGLQGQLNRLSTEWNRFKASVVDADATAQTFRTLASAMKTLADNGKMIGAVFTTALEWGALTAILYGLGKGALALANGFKALQAVVLAFRFSSITAGFTAMASALGPIALIAGAVATGFIALTGSTKTADDIFKRHQITIDAYREKMGLAEKAVDDFSKKQEEASKKALQRQLDLLKTDIGEALQGVNKKIGSVNTFSFSNLFEDGGSLVLYRKQIEELGRELTALGDKVTQQDLDHYATAVRAIDEKVRSLGLATAEWNRAMDDTVYGSNSFVVSLAAMIAKGVSLQEALESVAESGETAKAVLASDWKLNVQGVESALKQMDKEINSAIGTIQNKKSTAIILNAFPDVDPELILKACDAYDQATGSGKKYAAMMGVLRTEGAKFGTQISQVGDSIVALHKKGKELEEYNAKAEAARKARQKTVKTGTDQIDVTATKLEQLRKEVKDLEAANIPAVKSFDQIAKKLELERDKAIHAAEANAKLAVQRKQATATQASEFQELEIKKANLVYTQKLAEAEAKRNEEAQKAADIRLDFEKRYAEMIGISSAALTESILRQVEEYRKAGVAIVQLEQWKQDQILRAQKDAHSGLIIAYNDYLSESRNLASQARDMFTDVVNGLENVSRNMWEDFLDKGKLSMSGLVDLFQSTLAELLHLAVTKPIIVQIAGAFTGALTNASPVGATGMLTRGTSPLTNTPGLLSNLIPDSWKSGISGLASWTLPGTAATVPYTGTAGTVMSATGGAANVAGLHAAEAAATGGNAGGGMLAANAAGTTSGMGLGTALGYGAAGSLGYTMLGGALGLPQNKYSGLTAGLGGALGAWGGTAAGTAMGVAAGSTLGSVVPIVGTALGALAGGALGSLFGSGNKTHPGTGMRVHDAPLYSPGTDYRQLYVNEANYWRSSYKDSSPYFDTMGQVTQNIVSSMAGLANILPNADSLKAAMSGQTWTAGRKMEGSKGTWDFQAHDEEQLQQVIADATADIQRAVWDAMVNALRQSDMEDFGLKSVLDESDFSLSGLFDFASLAGKIQAQMQTLGEDASKYFYEAIGSIDLSPIQDSIFGKIDFSAGAGIEKFTAQLQTLSGVMGEVSSLQNPMGDIEKAAKDSMDQLAGWKASLSATGVDVAKLMNLEETRDSLLQQLQDAEVQCQNGTGELDASLQSLRARYAAVAQQAEDYGELIHHQEYLQNQLKDSFSDLWRPMGDVEKQAKANIDTINDYVEAAKRLEMSEEDITAIRNKASDLEKELVGNLRDLFYPLSDIEEQTKANLDVINDYAAAGKQLGMSEIELGQIEWYRNKVANDLVQSANAMTSSMGEMEKQARQNRDTLNEHKRAAEMAGASTAQLAEIENNRTKLQNQLMASVDATFNPLSEFAQLTQSITEETEDLIAAGKALGMTQQQLAEIESKRTAYLAQMQQQYRQDFSDDLSVRTAALHGRYDGLDNFDARQRAELERIAKQYGTNSSEYITLRGSQLSERAKYQDEQGQKASGLVQFEINQRKELEDVIKKFGKDSEEYIVLQGVLLAEKAQYQAELAQKAADAATSAYNSALSTAQSLQREAEQAEQAVIRAGEALEQAKAQAENARIALLEYYQTQVDTAKDALEAAKKAREEARIALVQGLLQAFDAAKNQMKTALDAWVTEADRLYTEAQNAYVNALKNNLDTATSAFQAAQNAYKEALGSQISEVDATVNKFKDLAESMRKLRSDLWLDATLTPNGEQGVYDTSKNQMKALYSRALSGDADAATELQNFSKTFLETSYKTQGDFSSYLRDFYNVQEMLADVQNKNLQQATLEQKTLDTLKAQLEAMEEPTRSLKELKEDMDKAYAFMQEQQKAWEANAEAQASIQEKTTEQLFQEMEAARTAADEAHAEQMAQYERWGFEAVVPGIAGLEQTYRSSLETLLSANKDLQQAIVEGITTQSEIASLRIDNSIKNLRDTYAQTQQAANQAQASYTKALNDQIAAQAKYGTVTIQTQLQKLQDALVASQRAVNDAAEKYYKAQTAAQNAAKAAAEAQKRAAEAAAEASRQQAEAAKAQQNAQQQANKVWSDDRYYQNKVKHLNSIAYEGRTNWTVDDVKKAFAKAGLTVQMHYEKYGKDEGVTGYANGGIPPVGVPVIVGEQGPELAVFGSQARIYTAQETQRMLFQPSLDDAESMRLLLHTPAWGTDGDARAENAMLREELRTMNTTMKEMRKELEGICKNTKESASSLDRLDTDGISQRSTQKPVRRTTWAE